MITAGTRCGSMWCGDDPRPPACPLRTVGTSEMTSMALTVLPAFSRSVRDGCGRWMTASLNIKYLLITVRPQVFVQ